MPGAQIWGWDGTVPRQVLVDASGHLQVDTLSSALPTGAATSAKQDTIIGHVDGLEALLGAGLPVALDTLSLKVKEQGTPSVHLYGYDGAAWQTLLTESDTLKNLRVRLYSGANPITEGLLNEDTLTSANNRGLDVRAAMYIRRSGTYQAQIDSIGTIADAGSGVTSVSAGLMGYNGATFDRLRTESSTAFNLRTKLYDGATGVAAWTWSATSVAEATNGLATNSKIFLSDHNLDYFREWRDAKNIPDADDGTYFPPVNVMGYNGSTWDRLRSYPTGILKVGRAEVGLSNIRVTAAGQIKASAGKLYWITVTATAAGQILNLSDDTNGLTAAIITVRVIANDTKHLVFDPPLEFATGIYAKTVTNSEVTAGYL